MLLGDRAASFHATRDSQNAKTQMKIAVSLRPVHNLGGFFKNPRKQNLLLSEKRQLQHSSGDDYGHSIDTIV